jgi:hypothetical protein
LADVSDHRPLCDRAERAVVFSRMLKKSASMKKVEVQAKVEKKRV